MRRIGAGVLDVLFVIILSVLVSMALPGTAGVMVLFPPLWFFYHFLFDFLSGGMTYGKMIMKLKVEISSSRLGFAFFHALGKTVLWFLSGFLPLLLLCGNGRMPYDRWLRLKQTDSQGRELSICLYAITFLQVLLWANWQRD